MDDEIKNGTAEAINKCRVAGIKIKLMTEENRTYGK